jgi:hypothetical protein
MLGFRSQVDTLEHMKALRLFQNDARQMGASTIGAVRLMVSRAKLPEENPCSLLLDRNGHWVVCFTVDRDAWFERITDQCLLGILETGGWELGLDVLKSIDVMVEDSIAERQKRLNDCKTHCNAHVGLSLSRLNAWRR